MDFSGITVLGLGPGDPGLLTRQAWQVLETSPEIYLRTRKHPVVASLPDTVQLFSFDSLYEESQTFEQVYEKIVLRVLELGQAAAGCGLRRAWASLCGRGDIPGDHPAGAG